MPASGWLLVLFTLCLFPLQIAATTEDDSAAAPSPHPALPLPICHAECGQDGHPCWCQGRQGLMTAPCSQHRVLGSGCPPLVLIYCQTQMKESGSETAGQRKMICFYASAVRRRCVGVLGAVRKTVSSLRKLGQVCVCLLGEICLVRHSWEHLVHWVSVCFVLSWNRLRFSRWAGFV